MWAVAGVMYVCILQIVCAGLWVQTHSTSNHISQSQCIQRGVTNHNANSASFVSAADLLLNQLFQKRSVLLLLMPLVLLLQTLSVLLLIMAQMMLQILIQLIMAEKVTNTEIHIK